MKHHIIKVRISRHAALLASEVRKRRVDNLSLAAATRAVQKDAGQELLPTTTAAMGTSY